MAGCLTTPVHFAMASCDALELRAGLSLDGGPRACQTSNITSPRYPDASRCEMRRARRVHRHVPVPMLLFRPVQTRASASHPQLLSSSSIQCVCFSSRFLTCRQIAAAARSLDKLRLRSLGRPSLRCEATSARPGPHKQEEKHKLLNLFQVLAFGTLVDA